MTDQSQVWAGAFGDEYLKRNRVNWRARVPFWTAAIGMTKPDSVIEVGANAGWNLRAIREASPGTYVCGVDVNKAAAEVAQRDGLDVWVKGATNIDSLQPCDLAFTAGVLIHVGPDQLQAVMQSVIDHSRQYVLAIEYASDKEEQVEYRGEAGLWKRPFGELYEAMGLTLLHQGPAGEGFDRCEYWLLEKQQ